MPYSLYVEFSDDFDYSGKYYIDTYEEYEVAESKVEIIYKLLCLDSEYIEEIGVIDEDFEFSFFHNSLYGRTNGFFHIYIVLKDA